MSRSKKQKPEEPTLDDEIPIWEFVHENMCQLKLYDEVTEQLFKQYLDENPEKKFSERQLIKYYHETMTDTLYKTELPCEIMLSLYKELEIPISKHVEVVLESRFPVIIRIDKDRHLRQFTFYGQKAAPRMPGPNSKISTWEAPVTKHEAPQRAASPNKPSTSSRLAPRMSNSPKPLKPTVNSPDLSEDESIKEHKPQLRPRDGRSASRFVTRRIFKLDDQFAAWKYIYREFKTTENLDVEVLPKGLQFWREYVRISGSDRTAANWSSHFRKQMCPSLHEMPLKPKVMLYLYSKIDIKIDKILQKTLESKFKVDIKLNSDSRLDTWSFKTESNEDEDGIDDDDEEEDSTNESFGDEEKIDDNDLTASNDNEEMELEKEKDEESTSDKKIKKGVSKRNSETTKKTPQKVADRVIKTSMSTGESLKTKEPRRSLKRVVKVEEETNKTPMATPHRPVATTPLRRSSRFCGETITLDREEVTSKKKKLAKEAPKSAPRPSVPDMNSRQLRTSPRKAMSPRKVISTLRPPRASSEGQTIRSSRVRPEDPQTSARDARMSRRLMFEFEPPIEIVQPESRDVFETTTQSSSNRTPMKNKKISDDWVDLSKIDGEFMSKKEYLAAIKATMDSVGDDGIDLVNEAAEKAFKKDDFDERQNMEAEAYTMIKSILDKSALPNHLKRDLQMYYMQELVKTIVGHVENEDVYELRQKKFGEVIQKKVDELAAKLSAAE